MYHPLAQMIPVLQTAIGPMILLTTTNRLGRNLTIDKHIIHSH
jgi:hypothetical protein